MTHDDINKLDPRIADLIKKYITSFVVYGGSALKDLNLEDQRVLMVAFDKLIK